MTIIDTYPNVERTITSIEASLISEREYEILKSISRDIRNNNLNTNLAQYTKNYDLIKSNTGKEIIIGNILLPNDYEIAELLTKYGFTTEHLKTIIRFRSLLKNIILSSSSIDEELERQFKIYKKYVSKIIEIFKLELKFDNQTIILNRITEILQTHSNYFENKNSEHTKKK